MELPKLRGITERPGGALALGLTILRWVGALIALFALCWLVFSVTQLNATNADLSGTLARRSPVVAYQTASNKTQACRDVVRYTKDSHIADFDAHLAELIQLSQTSPPAEIQRVKDEIKLDHETIVADKARLEQIDKLCPYPSPPEFDGSGNLIGDPPVGPELPQIPPSPN